MLKALWLLLIALFTVGDTDTDLDDDTTTDDGDDSDDSGDDTDDDDDSGAGGGDNDLDSDALRKELSKTRREAAKHRTERNAERERVTALESQNKAILKALGIADDDDNNDPSVEVEKLRQENARLRTRQSFDASAREAGADEDLTWGYLLARGEIDALDPSSDDFAKTLQESIAAALEAKPSLAIKPRPPSRGGADFDSGDDTEQVKPEEMEMSDYMKWRAERDKE